MGKAGSVQVPVEEREKSKRLSSVWGEKKKRSLDLLAHLLANPPGALEQEFHKEKRMTPEELKDAIADAVEDRKRQACARYDCAKKLLWDAVAGRGEHAHFTPSSLTHSRCHRALSLLGDLHDHVDAIWSWEAFRSQQHVAHVPWSHNWMSVFDQVMEFHNWTPERVVVKDKDDKVIGGRMLRRPESLDLYWTPNASQLSFPIHIEEQELDRNKWCPRLEESIASWFGKGLSFSVPVRFHCNSVRLRVTGTCFITLILGIALSVGLLIETLTSVFTPIGVLPNNRWYLVVLPALMMFCAFLMEGFVKLAFDSSRTIPLADFQVSVLLGVMSLTWPRFLAVILWCIGALALQLPSNSALSRTLHFGPYQVVFVWARALMIVAVVAAFVAVAAFSTHCFARRQRLRKSIEMQIERDWKLLVLIGFFGVYYAVVCVLDEFSWGMMIPIASFGLGTAAVISLFKTRMEILTDSVDADKRALVYPEQWECQLVDIIYFLVVEVVPVGSGIRGAFKYHSSSDGRGWVGALWRGYLWGTIFSALVLVVMLQLCNLFMSGRASKAKRAILKALKETKFFPEKAEAIRHCLFKDYDTPEYNSEKFRLGIERECHKELVRAFHRQNIFPGIVAQAPRVMFYEAFQNTQETLVGIIAYEAEMTNLSVSLLWHVWWSAFAILIGYIIFVESPSCDGCSISMWRIPLMSLIAFLLIMVVQIGWWLRPQLRLLCFSCFIPPIRKNIRQEMRSQIKGHKHCIFWKVWCSVFAALMFCFIVNIFLGHCSSLFTVIIGLLILLIIMTSWALWISSSSYDKDDEKDWTLVPAVLPCFIIVITWILFSFFSQSWHITLQVVVLSPMSLVVVNFTTDTFHRIYPGVVGRSFWRITFVVWGVFVLLMLAPAFNLGENLPTSKAVVSVFNPANSSVESNWKRNKSRMYGLCDLRYGSKVDLTALDLSQLAGVSYEEDCSIINQTLGLVFNDSSHRRAEMIDCTDYNDLPRIVVIDVWASQSKMHKTRVIAIKGTSTLQDMFTDATLYSAVKVLQFIGHVIPVIDFIPVDQVQWFLLRVHFPGQILRELSLFNQSATNISRWVDNFTGDATNDRNDVILTGHSLGGAFAQIMAARLDLPALVFSSPGVQYSASRFGIHHSALSDQLIGPGHVEQSSHGVQVLRSGVHNVVPDFDQVPQVDRQLSLVDRIVCPHTDNSTILGAGFQGAADCHHLDRTACEIWRVCGDIHRRFFNCSESVHESEIGQWISPDPHF